MSIRSIHLVAAFALALPVVRTQAPVAAPQGGEATPKPAAKTRTLFVGDQAPALTIEKWVKGQPVQSFQPGQVYMIEFWATWCGPCIASMPHITELQKKYRDQGFTVIGVTSTDKRNTLEKVEEMVKAKGETMGYAVAWDKERATNGAFMQAAMQRGIPCSFLVDQSGRIAYIGHPAEIDETLEKVMAKKHDIRALAEQYKHKLQIEARAEEIQAALGKAMEAEEWIVALKSCDDLLALDAKEFGAQVAMMRFQIYLEHLKDFGRAYAIAGEFLTGAGKDNANGLNMMAWSIVDPAGEIERRDLDLALKLATRAVELTKEKNAEVLDTLARVHFWQGDVQKAVDVQTKAVAINKKLDGTLQEYKDALAKKVKG